MRECGVHPVKPHRRLQLAILGRRAQRWSGYSETGRMWWGQHTRRTAHARELYKPEETWKRATLALRRCGSGKAQNAWWQIWRPPSSTARCSQAQQNSEPSVGGWGIGPQHDACSRRSKTQAVMGARRRRGGVAYLTDGRGSKRLVALLPSPPVEEGRRGVRDGVRPPTPRR